MRTILTTICSSCTLFAAIFITTVLLLFLTDYYIPHLHSMLLLLQSVIVRLRTGLQAGAEKNVAAAFALWRSATTHYTVYRRTTLTSYFAQVQHVCMYICIYVVCSTCLYYLCYNVLYIV